jgi:hypothetical protein
MNTKEVILIFLIFSGSSSPVVPNDSFLGISKSALYFGCRSVILKVFRATCRADLNQSREVERKMTFSDLFRQ